MEFEAKVHKLGINPCVDVPERIINALLSDGRKQRSPLQVKGWHISIRSSQKRAWSGMCAK